MWPLMKMSLTPLAQRKDLGMGCSTGTAPTGRGNPLEKPQLLTLATLPLSGVSCSPSRLPGRLHRDCCLLPIGFAGLSSTPAWYGGRWLDISIALGFSSSFDNFNRLKRLFFMSDLMHEFAFFCWIQIYGGCSFWSHFRICLLISFSFSQLFLFHCL